ncbi:hypothetical protein [Bacillus sp. FJAT-27264]|uniref:hypothetical protein n=1 Tax=Paenibacillus sp. (strain DSM 101736 / FJAT-27264) TaxID=1850362 RepID=UPI0015860310|nr:hypothetical protein [Bacillus sp. FJAT-27264]
MAIKGQIFQTYLTGTKSYKVVAEKLGIETVPNVKYGLESIERENSSILARAHQTQ